MIKYKTSPFSAALVGLFLGTPFALAYTTTFDASEGYTVNTPLSGQQGWVTNDPFVADANGGHGQADNVEFVAGLSSNAGDYFGRIGQFVPGMAETNVSHTVDLVGNTTFNFTVDFAIFPFTDGIRDTFGFTFRDSADQTLFSLRFTPDTTIVEQYNIRFFNAVSEQTASGSGAFNLFDNQLYRLDLTVDEAGSTDVTVATLTSSGATPGTAVTVINDAPVGPVAGTIDDVAITWILTDQTTMDEFGGFTGAGGNSIGVTNLSAVPEPGTGLLLVGGLAGLLARRRR